MASISEKPQLPYLSATVSEVGRRGNVIQIQLMRQTTHDTVVAVSLDLNFGLFILRRN